MTRLKANAKRRIVEFVDRRFNGFTHDVDGRPFRIPIINGTWPKNFGEKWMSVLIRRLLRANPGVFVDIGVNTGQTLLKVKSIEDQVRYVGIEPNSVCINYVHRLILENRFQNSDIVPVGASDREGLLWLEFYSQDESDTCASTVENLRPGNATGIRKCVPVATLDLIRSHLQLPKIGIIKIDVEGAERDVFRGMRQSVMSDRPMIIVEVLHAANAARLPDFAERVSEMSSILQALDYRVLRIQKTEDDQEIRAFAPVSSFEVKVWDSTSRTECDYVCVPTEKGHVLE